MTKQGYINKAKQLNKGQASLKANELKAKLLRVLKLTRGATCVQSK